MVLEPKVIARFDSLGEAEAARSALDAAEIPSALVDENLIAVDWFYARAIGGIRLTVSEENVEAALEVLNATAEQAVPAASEPEPEPEPEPGDDVELRCPECGSLEVVASRRFETLAVFTILILAIGYAIDDRGLSVLAVAIIAAIVAFTPSRVCRECGSRFRFTPVRAQLPMEEVSPDEARKLDIPCPRCGSVETYGIRHRRYKAATMLTSAISVLFAVLLVFWPFLSKRQCDDCGLRW